MKIKLTGFFCLLAVCLVSSQSYGAVFDFMSWANQLERGYSQYSRTVDGLTVTATGSSINNSGVQVDYFAYMDSGDAGLGVCKNLNSSFQCEPSNDDNLTSGEMLTLEFDSNVTIDSLLFRNADHLPIFSATDDFGISVDNNAFSYYQLVPEFDTPLTGKIFSFIIDSYDFNNAINFEGEQIYISSLNASAAPVPVPASVFLLGSGLLSVFSIGLRKKKS